MPGTDALVEDLRRERDAFMAMLASVDPGSMTTPGLVGEWSAREAVAHLGYWAGHAAEVIHAVEMGRADEAGVGELSVHEVNATVARVAQETPLATVLKREAASVEALIERLTTMDPALLATVLPGGATLEAAVGEDASVHYREHAEDLRRVLQEPVRG